MKTVIDKYWLLFLVFFYFYGLQDSSGQYFGRNKTRYQQFNFKVLRSPHFELYHYLDDTLAHHVVEMSERWYDIHQPIFRDTITFKNPIIIYNNHSEFQQTGVIGGLIGSGTGGVTEALKNRVIMPLTDTWAQTDHVLGHELVHAFQYNMVTSKDDTLSLKDLQDVPLWMIEGLAEYLSIGNDDPNTAMWMRDAVRTDDFPTIKELTTTNKYFPYRFGHAFWAFVGATWGDDKVMELYKNTVRFGLKKAFKTTLQLDMDSVSRIWKNNAEMNFSSFKEDTVDYTPGVKVKDKTKGRVVNISPTLSPDGRYLALLSQRDLFTIDLFIADRNTGEIVRKVTTSKGLNSHIDGLSFLESGATWSPDGQRLAIVLFSKGRNKLGIVNPWKNGSIDAIEVPGIRSISNPDWSPDGKRILLTGLVDGKSDLYVYDIASKTVNQLTDDLFSDIQPAWSPDGNSIIFATDRSENFSVSNKFKLALIDPSSREIDILPLPEGINYLDPDFISSDQIVFLSDAGGFRNLFAYTISTGALEQLTDLFTGISGITLFSPAISVNYASGDIAYSHYEKGGYNIYMANLSEFNGSPISEAMRDNKAPLALSADSSLNSFFIERCDKLEVSPDSIREDFYKPKFKLDYIANSGAGVSYGSYGLGINGGVNMIFSDMLGHNQLFTGLGLNGEIYDFGGQILYLNQKNRMSWGSALSHIPYRVDYIGLGTKEIAITSDSSIIATNYIREVVRIFEDQASIFTYYPLSTTRRIEFTGTMSKYSYRVDRFNNYYYKGWYIDDNREKLEAPEGYSLWRAGVAYVGDDSYFGITSPLKGHRFRFDLNQYGGHISSRSVLADFRQYHFVKPVGFAFRAYYYGRYGKDSESGFLSPLFLGNPVLIRGYSDVRFSNYIGDSDLLGINDLYGSKMLVGNFEVRIPFSGPRQLSLIQSKWFLTDLSLFIDMGTIWGNAFSSFAIEEHSIRSAPLDKVIISSGVSLRINFFGQVIIEPYYAFPFNRTDLGNQKGVFGLNFTPGW